MSAASGVAAGVLVWWVLWRRAAALQIPGYDTAFFEQVVWNLGHGRGWTSGYFGANFLGLHFEPLLLLPALIERVVPDWRVLLVLEALGVAASAPAAVFFFQALLGRRRGAGLAATALGAPLPFWILLQTAAAGAFHTEILALPLLLFAGGLGLRGRWWGCWVLLLLGLAAKEDEAYATLVLGLLLWRHGPSRAQGAAIAALSLAWAGALELWLMPHLLAGTRSDLASYYAWLRHPTAAAVAGHLVQPAGWVALGLAVLGMAGLPLLRPVWLLLVAPPFVGSLLSDHWPQPALQFQYGLPVVLPLLVAGGLGAARLLDAERPWVRRLTLRPALAGLAIPALLLGATLGPLAGRARSVGPSRIAPLAACLRTIPAGAPVAADDDTAVWLAARPQEVPLTWSKPDEWLVVDRRTAPPGYVAAATHARILQELPRSGRRLACSAGAFEVWAPALRGGR